MPVFNELATVEAAIDDALTAELPVKSRELVIVDDGSTDGTRERLAAREWPEGVTVVFHELNLGKGSAVRTALQHATGELAAILDTRVAELLATRTAGDDAGRTSGLTSTPSTRPRRRCALHRRT